MHIHEVLFFAAILGAVVGCSSMTTTPRGQTTEIVAVGIPAVAWISHTSQEADHSGSDTNSVIQSNSVDTATEVSK